MVVGDAEIYLCNEGGKFLKIPTPEDPLSSKEQDRINNDEESKSEDLGLLHTALVEAQA